MKLYKIKEIFFSLQGEGFHTGRPAIFCRFSGCNLRCSFCDTDHFGTDGNLGGEYSLKELVDVITSLWPKRDDCFIGEPFVVLTGGEPALQIDSNLIELLHKKGFYCAVETNGTLKLPPDIDWICVSPKVNSTLEVRSGNELKVVYPQPGLDLNELEDLKFDYFYIQPLNNETKYIKEVVDICFKNPKWRLSLQIHKIIGIP